MNNPLLNRRDCLLAGTATFLGLCATFAGVAPAQAERRRRVLLFTKSSGFQHDVIKRKGDEPSIVGRALSTMAERGGFELIESKDGRLFEPDSIAQFDQFIFYTSGDLTQPGTDGQPPMSEAGKAALLAAVENGKGFVGLHSAADTFRGAKETDPYIQMLGAEFVSHGKVQDAQLLISDENFPGVEPAGAYAMKEEWYAFTRFAPDIRPLMHLQTRGMDGPMYNQKPYPIVWTRTHGKGRVFYIGPGHLAQTWQRESFVKLVETGVTWTQNSERAKTR